MSSRSSQKVSRPSEVAQEDWDLFQSVLAPVPDQPMWEWAEQDVAFRKPYSAMYEGPYDSSHTPIWREPMEKFQDRSVRELWILKPSQGGGTENNLLMPMRWCVARSPRDILYIGGDMKATEEFIRERIQPGLQLSKGLRDRWRDAKTTEHNIYYPDMMIVCGWSNNQQIYEMRGVDVVLADEFDAWASYGPEKIRSRVRTKAFGKIVGVSSIYLGKPGSRRASSDHPILREIRQTDQRRVFVPPPRRKSRTQSWFKFDWGWRDKKSGQESPFGLKWSKDARTDAGWDYEAVRESAYYLTPGGQKLDDDMRRDLLERHEWHATAEVRDKSVLGYTAVTMDLPFQTHGDIAVRFLKACAKKDDEGDTHALKVFVARELCEEPADEVERPRDDDVENRQAEYARGQRFTQTSGTCDDNGTKFKDFYIGQETAVIIDADVQKDHLWWVAREWVKSGDSGLINYGTTIGWDQLDERARKEKATWVGVDAGYGERTQEVYEACWKYKFIPHMGRDNITDFLFQEKIINPFEGKRKQAKRYSIGIIYFRTDPFKLQLLRRLRGESDQAWYVHHAVDHEYRIQLGSEQRGENGKWDFRPGHPRRNHLWDCEVGQLVLATRFGFNRFRGFDTDGKE